MKKIFLIFVSLLAVVNMSSLMFPNPSFALELDLEVDDPIYFDDDLPPLPYVQPKLLTFSCESRNFGYGGGIPAVGGTGPSVEGASMNGLVTIPENTCTAPDGYGFAGWYNDVESDTNQTAVVTQPGDSYLYMPDDINPLKYLTLYAYFQPIYTVTYSCGNGTGNPPTTNNVVYTTSYTPSSNTCTPPNGLTFAGWGVDGTNDVKAAGIAFQWNYSGNKTLTAQYGLPYTVSYSCGNGSGTPPSNATAVYGGEFLPAISTCTPPNGKIFTGWLISGTNDVENSIFKWNYSANKTLTAQYENAKFTVITTAVDTLQFNLSASGVFYVDCGAGGTLSGNGVYGTKIDRTTLLHSDRYTCSYPSASGSKTIRFTGLATGYNKNVNMTVTSTLSFYTSIIDNEVRTDISSVSGDLSSMFPYFGSDYGESPRFLHTFSHQTNLTSLPDNLFSGYTNVGKYMFWATFYDCTNLTGYIPPTLFAGLIANGHPTGNDIWYGVFTNTQLVTECPSGTVEYTTGYKSTWDGKVSCTPTNTLSVTYSCGTGSGTAPASTTATYNASFTPAASTCTPPTGYHFTGWLVDGEWVEKPAGTAFTWQYVTGKTFTAQYAINTISLTFDNGSPMSCTFGGTFLPPTPAARPGWIFTGWKAVTCADKIKRQDTSTNGTAYAYQNDSTGAYGSSSENTSSYGITTDNTWAVEFDYGTVWGRANCNNTSGTPVIASVPTLASSGTNCWCQVTGFTVSGNSYTYGPQCTVLPVSSLWLFQGANGSTDTCANVCARSCAYIVQSVANLRGVIFNAVGQ